MYARHSRIVALVASAGLWVGAAGTASAQTQSTTTAPPRVPLFTWNDAWLGAAFLGGTLLLRPVDEHYAERLQDPGNQTNRFLQNVATGFRTIAEPGSWIIGGSMYAIGRLSKQRNMADLGLHGTEAIIVGSGLAGVLKGVFGRARPYVHPPTDSTGFDPQDFQFGRGFLNPDFQSFPSGHTVAAFAAAAAVANETSRWWPSWKWAIGPAMYGGAAMVGLSRMYNNKHWASDVMMGAAIGTFAGNKVVRFHHRTRPGNRFDKWMLGGSIAPGSGGGLNLSWSLIPLPR